MTEQTLVEDILFTWNDMHSHCDIVEWEEGFSVVRTYEIDDGEGNSPREGYILSAKTLPELQDLILKIGRRS